MYIHSSEIGKIEAYLLHEQSNGKNYILILNSI